MKKILVNSPKGGVGKTTISTNIALILADMGYRVWALDLAQGSLMTKVLENHSLFKDSDIHRIQSKELELLPKRYTGARSYDFLVVDTDDYYEVLVDLIGNRGWYVAVPIVDRYYELERIPQEISEVLKVAYVNSQKIQLSVIHNMSNGVASHENIRKRLSEFGLKYLLLNSKIEYCNNYAPYFLKDRTFYQQLKSAMSEMGVI